MFGTSCLLAQTKKKLSKSRIRFQNLKSTIDFSDITIRCCQSATLILPLWQLCYDKYQENQRLIFLCCGERIKRKNFMLRYGINRIKRINIYVVSQTIKRIKAHNLPHFRTGLSLDLAMLEESTENREPTPLCYANQENQRSHFTFGTLTTASSSQLQISTLVSLQ